MKQSGYVLATSSAALAALVSFAMTGSAADPLENRYPYDPACAWGRLADGKGMIVRCLTDREAASVLALKAGSTKPVDPAALTKEEKAKEEATKTESTETGADAGATDGIAVELVDVKVDTGKLSTALKKLKIPSDRYIACVRDHGGLQGKNGEVQVRFLVRQRGRAEGVSVAKRTNVSAEGARCVADVVDRRPVGTPEEEMVGATAIFRFSRP